MVMVLTQFTEDFSFTKRIPTQIWSYILALFVLIPALAFTDGITVNTFIQSLFKGVIVSIAANGGYSDCRKLWKKLQTSRGVQAVGFLSRTGC